jgi:hypothetical protein
MLWNNSKAFIELNNPAHETEDFVLELPGNPRKLLLYICFHQPDRKPSPAVPDWIKYSIQFGLNVQKSGQELLDWYRSGGSDNV